MTSILKNIFNKKYVLTFILFIMLIFIILFSHTIFAKSYVYKWTNIKEVEVTAYKLNVRTGPGTSYMKIGLLSQGDIVEVVGTLGSWYVVHTNNDMIGLISSTYTRIYSYHDSNAADIGSSDTKKDSYSYNITSDEQDMVDLINGERIKNNLSPYKIDMELMRVARIKAEDIANNQYFSHNSPTYGTPFNMLSAFSISYISAGENIAGNSNIAKAHTSLMDSPSHRANILSSDFNYVGIGIANDSRYGKVFVQLFIKK